jgi:hypothetical protein
MRAMKSFGAMPSLLPASRVPAVWSASVLAVPVQ